MTEFGQDLAGQVALITGAGQGIGRTFANGFARAGAKVAIVELNEIPMPSKPPWTRLCRRSAVSIFASTTLPYSRR